MLNTRGIIVRTWHIYIDGDIHSILLTSFPNPTRNAYANLKKHTKVYSKEPPFKELKKRAIQLEEVEHAEESIQAATIERSQQELDDTEEGS